MAEENKKNDRLTKLYTELNNEFINKFQALSYVENVIRNRVITIQSALSKQVKENCKESFEWIKANTIQNHNQEGPSLLLKDENLKQDSHRYFEQFKQCASKFDFNLEGRLQGVQKEMMENAKEFLSCNNECIAEIDNKTDEVLKPCLKTCIEQSLVKNEGLQKKIIGDLDSLLKKI